MSWELTWRLPWGDLRADRVRQAAATVAAAWPGVRFEVDVEDRDTISLFFQVPAAMVAAAQDDAAYDPESASEEQALDVVDEEQPLTAALDDEPGAETYTIELSFYDLESDGRVFSLEGEWSDNTAAWDAACALAEDLAAEIGAEELEL